MADHSVEVEHTDEVVQGQPQAKPAEPHDGQVRVQETHVVTDRVILDPNSPEAVQVPDEGTSTNRPNPLGDALRAGTAEEQFSSSSTKVKTTRPAREDEKADK